MVADNCWEEYMWKVHHAIAIDPWQSTFHLLDVLIDDEFSDDALRTGLAARLLRSFRRKMSVRRSFASGKLRRVGSMLTVGDDSSSSWQQNVETLISQGLTAVSSKDPKDEREVVIDSGKSAPAENGPKSAADGSVPADSKQGKSADGSVPADAKPEAGAKAMETSNPIEPAIPNSYRSLFRVRDLPDMAASVASTTSILASLGISSNLVSGQFDAKNTKTVKCNFSGVRSHKVSEDALAQMVGADGRKRTPDWKPAISNPLLRWSPKRGQRLWIVTEIMYANKIEVENDVKKGGEASVSAKSQTAKGGTANVTAEIGRDVMWTVSAGPPEQGMRFPFAFRMMRLDYDPHASLLLNSFLPQHLFLSRSQSMSSAPNPNPNPNLRSSSISSSSSRSSSRSFFIPKNE